MTYCTQILYKIYCITRLPIFLNSQNITEIFVAVPKNADLYRKYDDVIMRDNDRGERRRLARKISTRCHLPALKIKAKIENGIF